MVGVKYKSRHLFFLACSIALLWVMTTKQVFASYYTTSVLPGTYKNIGTPRDILVLPDGSYWYADSQNYRLVKVNAAGAIVRTVGRQGTDEGEFEAAPLSITRDADGYLYVIDSAKVYKLDQYGGYISSWGEYGNGAGQLAESKAIHYSAHNDTIVISNGVNNRVSVFTKEGSLVREFGSGGTGDGQFDAPHGLTTDSVGNIYVVDANNHRVQVFSEVGTFIRAFGTNSVGDDQLVFPKDIEVLSNGDVLVTSQNAALIKRFSATGTYISQWGESGTGTNQFIHPEYLGRESDDSVWVSDWNQKRIQHFTDAGVYLEQVGNSGATDGLFTNPFSFDFDASGNIYALDSTGRVQKFDADGNFIATVIGSGAVGSNAYHLVIDPNTSNILVSSEATVSVFESDGSLIAAIGTQGLNGANSGPGDFNHARGMAFDSAGYLYVADLFNGRVQKFDLTHLADADFATTYSGGYVSGWNVMTYAEYIAIDADDNIYVSSGESVEENSFALQIIKYSTLGVQLEVFLDQYGTDPGQYYKISGLSIDGDGNIYVTDNYFNHVLIYNASGVHQETIGSSGGDIDQFDEALRAKINPSNNSMVVADRNNHRLQILETGVKIYNLISSADVVDTTSSNSLVRSAINPLLPDASSLDAQLHFGDYVVSDFTVDLTANRNWQNVNAIMLPDESKSLVVNLNPTDAPGVSATHSLFVKKQVNQSSVRVCTDAVAIADVNDTCEGYVLNQGDPDLTVVTVDGVEYWRVDGLTGTGAMGIADATPSPTPSPTPTAAPNNTTTSGTSGASAQTTAAAGWCSDPVLAQIPDLFQINATDTTATLYFTPLSATNKYQVSFSTKSGGEDYGAEVELLREGVQSYQVFMLQPNTTYYFKVRGQSGCANGEWSAAVGATTKPKGASGFAPYYKYGISSGIRSLIGRKNLSLPRLSLFTEEPPIANVVPTEVAAPKEKALINQAETKTKKCTKFLWWCF